MLVLPKSLNSGDIMALEKMSKAEVVYRISELSGVCLEDAERMYNIVFSIMRYELLEGRAFQLSDIGMLVPVRRNPRVCRNPISGKREIFAARNTVSFKASKAWRKLDGKETNLCQESGTAAKLTKPKNSTSKKSQSDPNET